MKKKIAALVLTFVFALSAAACGSAAAKDTGSAAAKDTGSAEAGSAEEAAEVTIKVGANITPHSEILEQAKPLLKEKGINLEVVQLEDSITPNTGVIEGSLDANYFQHVPYLEQFNKENGSDLVSIGAIHYEPFGIYAGRTASLSEQARALLLLAQEGLLTLKEDAGIKATVEDITENPKNISFKELAPEQLVAALPDVDIAVINGNYAIEGGLHVSEALAVEANDGLAAETYGNIIATSPEKEKDEALLTLVEVLQGEEISKYIKETYGGAVVPLK